MESTIKQSQETYCAVNPRCQTSVPPRSSLHHDRTSKRGSCYEASSDMAAPLEMKRGVWKFHTESVLSPVPLKDLCSERFSERWKQGRSCQRRLSEDHSERPVKELGDENTPKSQSLQVNPVDNIWIFLSF